MKNFFKKHNKSPVVSTDHRPNIHPHKHWVKMLWFFFATVAILVFYSLYLLHKVKNDQISPTNTVSVGQTVLIQEDVLKNVTESFRQKAEKENQLKTNPPSIPDPSE